MHSPHSPVLSGAGASDLLLAPATSSAPELGSVRPPNRIARRLGATRAVSGTGERRPPAQRALRLGPSSAAAREAACAAEEPPSPPHLAADDAASSVKVSRTGRSLWERNGTPAGAPGATGSGARDPRAAGGAEAELLPLDRWLCRGELPGPAAASGLSPALSSDTASAPAAKDQALSAEEARLQAELAAASEEVRSLAAAAAAAAAGEQRAEAAAATAARACAERSPSTAGAHPDPEEAFRTPVKRAKHG